MKAEDVEDVKQFINIIVNHHQNCFGRGYIRRITMSLTELFDDLERVKADNVKLTAELHATDEKRVTEQSGRTVAENECCVLRGEIDRLTNALQSLRDAQNGPPLIRDTEEWEAAMKLADEALRENENENG